MASEASEAALVPSCARLAAFLHARPGASLGPPPAPGVLMFKVMGRMFAILATRRERFVILKCDPHLAEVLREEYVGVGHRSHLDRRFWVSVNLEADVAPEEIERLAAGSYELVCAGLTRKQKAELAALAG